MITIVALDSRVTMDHVGLIPSFLDPDDPRPAHEQFNTNYAHGGGWWPMSGFTLDLESKVLTYPGDPPCEPLALIPFREERIYIYESAFVAIVQPDNTYEVSRMD
jgi:hypothetical protein